MPKFRKKPVVIEAMQLNGPNGCRTLEVVTWLAENGAEYRTETDPFEGKNDVVYIKTLEGEMKASPGDYIIKGVTGEFYPCQPDVFVKTYEPAESADTPDAGVVVVPVKELKAQIRKAPRYTSPAGVLFPDPKGELVELGAVLSILGALSRLQQNGGEPR